MRRNRTYYKIITNYRSWVNIITMESSSFSCIILIPIRITKE